MSDEVLVKVEGVSKKFCRSLKRSLWYGVQDVSAEMFGRKGSHDELRKNEFWAVNDVSFELRRGECLGLIGPNGAGKSTLLKMLNGLVKPDKGRITMRGRVGALIELGAGFNPILTARENIYVNGSVLGFTKKEIDRKFDAIVDFAEIEEFIDTPVQNYSSGMKVRLGFAVAAQMEPDVLMIDEVLAVGDARFRLKSLNKVSELCRNATVLFVSHSMSMISRMSTRLMLIEYGSTAYLGSDIQFGVSRYLENVQEEARQTIESRYLELVEFSVDSRSSSSEGEQIQLALGQEVRFDLEFNVKNQTPDFIINLSFVDREGRSVAQCSSSFSNFVFRTNREKLAVSVTIPKLELNPDMYSVDVGAIESLSTLRQGEVLFHKKGVSSIFVHGEMNGWAPVQFSGKWDSISAS